MQIQEISMYSIFRELHRLSYSAHAQRYESTVRILQFTSNSSRDITQHSQQRSCTYCQIFINIVRKSTYFFVDFHTISLLSLVQQQSRFVICIYIFKLLRKVYLWDFYRKNSNYNRWGRTVLSDGGAVLLVTVSLQHLPRKEQILY